MPLLLKRLTFVLLVSMFAYGFCRHAINRDVLSTLYNVSGILFSVGMGLIIGFNFDGIKNEDYVKSIRFRLTEIRNNFIKLFTILTISYIINVVTPAETTIKISLIIIPYEIDLFIFFQYFTATYLICSFIYFTLTFIEVQKLKDDISDAVNR